MQLAIYLAVAPKSDAAYVAFNEVTSDIRQGKVYPVPMHLRNAPTRAMKEWGYGSGYQHAHDFPDAVPGMECLPENLQGRTFYRPTERGFEKEIKRRLDAWKEIKRKRRSEG